MASPMETKSRGGGGEVSGFLSPAELWKGEEARDKKSSSNGATMSCYMRTLRRVLKIIATGESQL